MTRQARLEADQAEYRASLDRADQALQEERDQPEPTEREVQLVKEQAERALAEGRTVFVTKTRSTTLQRLGVNLIGDSEVARVIDAVESAGWKLDPDVPLPIRRISHGTRVRHLRVQT